MKCFVSIYCRYTHSHTLSHSQPFDHSACRRGCRLAKIESLIAWPISPPSDSCTNGERHLVWLCHIGLVVQVAELTQLLPPCSPTVRNPAPDSSLKSCFSPIALASAAARRLHPLQLLLPGPIAASASTAAPRLPPPPAAAPDRVRFNCYSPIASASTAAPRLRPLQLLLARLCPLRLLLPDCILDSSPCPGPMFSNILHGVRGSVNKLKYASL